MESKLIRGNLFESVSDASIASQNFDHFAARAATKSLYRMDSLRNGRCSGWSLWRHGFGAGATLWLGALFGAATSAAAHRIGSPRPGAGVPRQERSPFGQLKLNAAIASIGVLAGAVVNRLKFTETRGDQARRPDAPVDQIPHHRDRARRRQIPV